MPSFRSAAFVSGWLGFALVSAGGSVAKSPPVIDPPPAPLTPPQAVPSPGPNASTPPTVRPSFPVRGPEDQPGVPQALPPVQINPVPQMTPVPQQGRAMFTFKIAPETPVKDLLPVPPKAVSGQGTVITEDLAKVPEVTFQGKASETARDGKMGPEGSKIREAAYQLAKINHLNAQKTDGFMVALLANRRDLEGIPFRMGDDCRTTGPKVQYFAEAAELVRRVLAGPQQIQVPVPMQQATSFPTPISPFTPPSVTSTGSPGPGGTQPPTIPAPPTQAAPPTPTLPPQLAEPRNDGPSRFSQPDETPVNAVLTSPAGPTRSFWAEYAGLCDFEDSSRTPNDKETMEMVTLARIAALTQMLAAESTELRLGLVKYLAGVSHVEATRALARMVIYTKEDDVRQAAISALKVRREKDYTDILVKALRYPWPAVSRRAAEAIAKLERTDLVPELVSLLESSDPRLPEAREKEGRETEGKYTVKELVKLNHHQNCMMCHPPADSGVPNPKALKAEVAIQGQPLPSPSEGYRQQNQDLFIRIDATYLRPDFSASLPVKDAHPWPEMQRFDFVVRERKLTLEEALTFREQLAPKEKGVLSPYHKGALVALREITGKDTTPNAESWRKLLDLPVKK